VIRARELRLSYHAKSVVTGLDLSVSAGEVVGLVGNNGAGKSTTLRAVAGILPPVGGQLHVADFDMADVRQAEAARAVVGYCPDVGGLLRACTPREHIGLALAMHRRSDRWPQAMELIERFGLLGVFEAETAGFSHGMSRRLSVLIAMLTAPDVLVLDEPFDGVDSGGVGIIVAGIRQAASYGSAVLVSSHLLDLMGEVCDRIVRLSNGRAVDGMCEPVIDLREARQTNAAARPAAGKEQASEPS